MYYYNKTKIKSKLPKSYRKRNGCYNCKYVFIKSDYDDINEYFCHKDNSYRPLCRSVAMEETWSDFCKTLFDDINFADKWNFNDEILEDNASEMFSDAFEIWATEHYVDSWNICEEWEKEEI